MKFKTEERLIIVLAIVIFVAITIVIDPSITGFVIYHPSCLDNYTLIQAHDQNSLITQLPENSHIYITYRNDTWPNWNTITEEFTQENNFSICVNTVSDQIKIKSCGKDECSNYAHIVKELGDDILALNNKTEFIITTANLNDQDGIINEEHQFYDNAFMNVYNTNNKLIFGCGNCHSTDGELKNNYQFIVPKESSYNYNPIIKTSVTTYNDIKGNITNIDSASEETISSTFRKIPINTYNEDCTEIQETAYIIKPSNDKTAYTLQNNESFLSPLESSIKYKIESGDLLGPVTINNSVIKLKISSQINCSGLVYEEIPCIEDWTCTNWTECINITQTRICTDLNDCQSEESKPAETQNCSEEEEEPEEETPQSQPSSGPAPSSTRYKSAVVTAPPTVTETKTVSQKIEVKAKEEPKQEIIQEEVYEKIPKNIKTTANAVAVSYLLFLCLLIYKRRHKL